MDRCIYELTFEHLKANRNIHRNSNWIWVSYNILHFTMVNEVPKLYLKASVFRADILHDVKTLSMKFYWPNHH